MQKTTPLLIRYVGTTAKASLPPSFQTALDKTSEAIETKYSKVKDAEIQGSEPHKSKKDPSDEKDVITVGYYTAEGTRVASVHIHEDGTLKEFPSRNASKGK